MARRRARKRSPHPIPAPAARVPADARGRASTRRPPGAHGPRAALASVGVLLLPVVAVLALLHPYLWPPGQAPTSEFSDIHHQNAPFVELLAEGLRRDGALPRWNVQDFAGLPTVGDPQAGTYNPVYWLLAAAPSVRAFGLLIVVYALLGALGFQLYARTLGLSAGAAAAGAIVFVFGGSLLLRLVLPGHTVYAPVFLVPLLLWVLARLATEPRPAILAGAGALIALVTVSLNPQILLYTAVALAPLLALGAARAPRPARALAACVAAVVLGAALAAVHLLPIVALAREFSRAHPELASAAADPAFTPDRTWLVSVVAGLGPVAGTDFAWETHLYVGGVALFLALLGLVAWPRGHRWRGLAQLHGALAAAIILFALGPSAGPGTLRFPTRAFVLLALPLGVLSALGVDALARAPARRRAVAGGATWLAALLSTLTGAATLLVALVAIAGAGALLRGTTAGTGDAGSDGASWPALAAVGALIAVLALDTGRVVAPAVRTAPEEAIGALAPGVTLPPDLAAGERIAELERGAAEPGIPELAVRRRGLETLAGANPLLPWRFVVYLSYANDLDPRAYHFDIAVPVIDFARPRLFDLLGVTHVLHPPAPRAKGWWWEQRRDAFPRAYLAPHPRLLPRAHERQVETVLRSMETLAGMDARREVLLHGPQARRALTLIGADDDAEFEPFRPVALAERSANRLTLDLEVTHPAILVLNEPYFPGWRAWDGGRELPVLRANVLFRALALAPGTHHVTLEFRPRAWELGWWISVLALVLTAVLAVAGTIGRRGGQPAAPSVGAAGPRPPRPAPSAPASLS